MSNATLLCIGSGPGIGRSVTSLFATKHYKNVALIARRPVHLRIEKAAVQEAAGPSVNVQTYALDATDTDALLSALKRIEEDLGRIECVFYNAARVQNSSFFDYDVKEIEYDFKVWH
jgi:NAD(P)-dependent dehydrogenase (short-subunit alcohol dehydrogenase family)